MFVLSHEHTSSAGGVEMREYLGVAGQRSELRTAAADFTDSVSKSGDVDMYANQGAMHAQRPEQCVAAPRRW